MGTRGYIAKQVGPDAYLTIYSCIENYPEHAGKLLLENYSSPELVDKLVALGDIWRLEKNLDPNPDLQHDSEKQQEDVILSFTRDAGESNCQAEMMTLEELDDTSTSIQFVYVFTLDNNWKYFAPGQAALGFRDIQADLDHPENIPEREHPLFEKLQVGLLGELDEESPEETEEPVQGPDMKMT